MASSSAPGTLKQMGSSGLVKILVVGDCMLGRLLDQVFPEHNISPEDHFHAHMIMVGNRASMAPYDPHAYIWGDTLPLFSEADLRIANLETSVTTSDVKWPGQAFNFRMHPANIKALRLVKIDFCSLANNHVLDFGQQGMVDTMNALATNGIAFAGCGLNLDQATDPAIVRVSGGMKVACFAASDHFNYWAASEKYPGIHLLDPESFTHEGLARLREKVQRAKSVEGCSMAAMSIHWGPNYAWQPSAATQQLAHALIDECGFSLIHGTSAHHVQGIEIYHGKPILYGCGDFVDDYAVDAEYRNDLGFAYMLHLDPSTTSWSQIELFPTHIHILQVTRAEELADRRWLFQVMKRLCSKFGTKVECHDSSLEKLVVPISGAV